LKEEIFDEGDTIIKYGDSSNFVFFIVKGKVATLDDNNEIIEVLKIGKKNKKKK
jgi:signal-transduction protein with cAMP-binding, CBS, and nucleotidyltransferase domain